MRSSPLTWTIDERRLAGMAGLGLSLVLALVPVQALGQQPAEEDVQAFREYLAQGAELIEAGELAAGIEVFEQAREIADHPRISLQIAAAYRSLGDCGQAGEVYRRVAEGTYAEAEQQLARRGLEQLEQCVDSGVVRVKCSPEEAVIHYGDQQWDCPHEQRLEAGEVELTISAPGFSDHTTSVVVEPGGEVEVQANLRSDDYEEWHSYVTYGMGGMAGLLLTAGLFTDLGSRSRARELLAAEQMGDLNRARQLEQESRSATRRAAFFYTTGVLAAGTTVLLMRGTLSLPGGATEEKSLQSQLRWSIGVSPAGASVNLQW